MVMRGEHRQQFVILPNATVRDERLSHMARGILADILSRPEGWKTNADEMADRGRRLRGVKRGSGREAYRAAFRELQDAGYIVRERMQGDRGRWQTVLVVFDEPQDAQQDAA